MTRLVHDALTSRGYDAYLDIENSRAGAFDSALREAIQAATDVVVILSSSSLDRCWDENDWLRAEVAHALAQNKNVIPVLDQAFEWPAKPMPSDLATLRTRQGLTLSHEYFEASMDKLVRELVVGRPRSTGSSGVPIALGRKVPDAIPRHRGIRLLLGFGNRRIEILLGIGLLSLAAAVGLWFWSVRPVKMASRFAQQDAVLREIIRHQEAVDGPEHLSVARTLTKQANLYAREGRNSEAIMFLSRALAIREAALSRTHPDVITNLLEMATLLANSGEQARAQALMQRVRETTVPIVVPDSSEVVRSASNNPDRDSLHVAIMWMPSPESFEQAWGTWGTESGVWQIGVPGVPGVAHSSTGVAATILAGNYTDYAGSRLISPPFVIPAADDPGIRLRFWHWWRASDSTELRNSGTGSSHPIARLSPTRILPVWVICTLAPTLWLLSYLSVLFWPVQRRVIVYRLGEQERRCFKNWCVDLVLPAQRADGVPDEVANRGSECGIYLQRNWWLRKRYLFECHCGECRVQVLGANTPTNPELRVGTQVFSGKNSRLTVTTMNDSVWSGWVPQACLLLLAVLLAEWGYAVWR